MVHVAEIGDNTLVEMWDKIATTLGKKTKKNFTMWAVEDLEEKSTPALCGTQS